MQAEMTLEMDMTTARRTAARVGSDSLLAEDRVASIRDSQDHWAKLADDAERWANFIEERAAAGVVMMDSPQVKRNQAETYRAVVKALELEITTGLPHCSCCLKPTGGQRSGIFR